MNEVVIVGGSRTAVGAFGGSLKTVPVVKLGSLVRCPILNLSISGVRGNYYQQYRSSKSKLY